MSHHLPRRPLLALVFATLAALAVGCSSSVIGGGGGSGGGGGAIDPPCDPGSCDPPHPTTGPLAIALKASEMNFDDGSGGSGGGTSGSGGAWPGVDPDTLFVHIGNTAQICTDPFAAQKCGSEWRVSIGVPPALQQPGIIPLSDVNASFGATGPDEGPDPQECWFAGGSFSEGTLEIVSIDATSLVVRLQGTDTFEFVADGEYTVERCFAP